ncbi:hypothetical protein L1887_23267 [Cichorium endivia]|nr:hypothetical protein L1887_23267 [Cichorium endivia]
MKSPASHPHPTCSNFTTSTLTWHAFGNKTGLPDEYAVVSIINSTSNWSAQPVFLFIFVPTSHTIFQ